MGYVHVLRSAASFVLLRRRAVDYVHMEHDLDPTVSVSPFGIVVTVATVRRDEVGRPEALRAHVTSQVGVALFEDRFDGVRPPL